MMVLGIVDRLVLAEEVLEEDGRHGRDVFVAEAQVSAGKSGVAGLHRVDANLVCAVQHVAGKYLLRDGHGPRLGLDRRQENLALHARHVEGEQAAVLDDLAGNLVLACGELAQRNLFAAANLVDQLKSVEVSTPRFWQFCL